MPPTAGLGCRRTCCVPRTPATRSGCSTPTRLSGSTSTCGPAPGHRGRHPQPDSAGPDWARRRPLLAHGSWCPVHSQPTASRCFPEHRWRRVHRARGGRDGANARLEVTVVEATGVRTHVGLVFDVEGRPTSRGLRRRGHGVAMRERGARPSSTAPLRVSPGSGCSYAAGSRAGGVARRALFLAEPWRSPPAFPLGDGHPMRSWRSSRATSRPTSSWGNGPSTTAPSACGAANSAKDFLQGRLAFRKGWAPSSSGH